MKEGVIIQKASKRALYEFAFYKFVNGTCFYPRWTSNNIKKTSILKFNSTQVMCMTQTRHVYNQKVQTSSRSELHGWVMTHWHSIMHQHPSIGHSKFYGTKVICKTQIRFTTIDVKSQSQDQSNISILVMMHQHTKFE